MSWLSLSIASACLLGFYDFFKKLALRDNAVLPVLFGSVCVSALVWLPLILWSALSPDSPPGSFLHVPGLSRHEHLLLFVKAALVGASWLCGYIGIKSLPLSIATPIASTAPLWTIVFAVFVFHESPTSHQWLGITVILAAFFAFTLVGMREGIRFHRDPAVFFMMAATLLGAASSLYDKFLLQKAAIPPSAVQAWFSIYLVVVLAPAACWWHRSKQRLPFHWHWAIPAISLTLLAADRLYFTAIARPDALISMISPVRSSSVMVSFLLGVSIFKEKQVYFKGACIVGIIAGVVMLS